MRTTLFERADAHQEAAQFVRRRRREEHRRIDVFEQAQMFAFVERVDVVDEDEVAGIDHVPVAVDRQQHRRTDDDAHAAVLQAFFRFAAIGRRGAAVDLPDADARAGETFGEVRDVLADQVARRREDDDVVVAGENRVDRDAQHDFGLARAGRRLQQELVLAFVERGVDFGDGRTLIVGQREAFTGLDQFVGGGDGLTVGVDLRPNVGVGRKGYASDSAPASWSGGVSGGISGVVSVSADGVSDRGSGEGHRQFDIARLQRVEVDRRQIVERIEPERFEKIGGRFVEQRPSGRFTPARLDDEAPVEQRRDHGVGADAADLFDLGFGHRFVVSDDRQRLERGGREVRLRRQQVRFDRGARRGRAREPVAAGDFAQHDAALGKLFVDVLQRDGDVGFFRAGQFGQRLDRDRFARHEQHGLDVALQAAGFDQLFLDGISHARPPPPARAASRCR